VLHVGLEHPLIGFIDFLNWGDFNVGRDAVLAEEGESSQVAQGRGETMAMRRASHRRLCPCNPRLLRAISATGCALQGFSGPGASRVASVTPAACNRSFTIGDASPLMATK
jgi:hypothetical protein